MTRTELLHSDCEPEPGETMGRFWQRTCPACIEAQERGMRLCDDHEDGDNWND